MASKTQTLMEETKEGLGFRVVCTGGWDRMVSSKVHAALVQGLNK